MLIQEHIDWVSWAMLRLSAIFAFLIAVASIFAHSGKFTAEWQSRYDDLSSSVRALNFAKFQSYVADSYTWVQPGGKTKNRKDSLAEFKPMFDMKKITGGEKVVKASKKGSQVDVTYDARWVMTGKDNKTSRFHEVGVDTWKQIGGKWMIVRSVDKISEMK